MTLHLRAASTSVVLDLPADRFPVVRHWGADLGDLPADALEDAGTAGAASVGTNTAWPSPCPARWISPWDSFAGV